MSVLNYHQHKPIFYKSCVNRGLIHLHFMTVTIFYCLKPWFFYSSLFYCLNIYFFIGCAVLRMNWNSASLAQWLMFLLLLLKIVSWFIEVINIFFCYYHSTVQTGRKEQAHQRVALYFHKYIFCSQQ